VQEFSKRLRVGESSEGLKTFKVVEGSIDQVTLEVCKKALQVCVRVEKFSEEETDGRNSLWRIREVP
jgi:hypothetical protein